MRIIQFNAPDGVYQLPVEVVAKNRTDYYAGKDGFTPGSDDYKDEFQMVCNDNFEAIDWLLNNMDFADVKDQVTKISDESEMQEDFWTCSDDFNIIEA